MVSMPSELRDLLRVQAYAFNSRDAESLVQHATAHARAIRDGELMGEGPEALRRLLVQEYGEENVVGRIMDLDGEPVLVEWAGPEGRREPRAVLRLAAARDRVTELSIDHDPDLVRRITLHASLETPA